MTRWQVWKRTPGVRHAIAAVGWLLIVLAPITAPLPGPGGTIVFAAGLALVLQTSPFAKRLYVRAGRRWPRVIGWVDWGLRRRSAARRRDRLRLAAAVASD